MQFMINSQQLIQERDSIVKILAGDYGKGYHREVCYHVGSREFRVRDHDETVLVTVDPVLAAEKFNQIRAR